MSQTTRTCLPNHQVQMAVSAVCFAPPSHSIPAVAALVYIFIFSLDYCITFLIGSSIPSNQVFMMLPLSHAM